MKKLIPILFAVILLGSCKDEEVDTPCDINLSYTANASKSTITTGIWGTVAFQEGNCMPGTGAVTCSTCPAERTIKIYQYTKTTDATASTAAGAGFYTSFNTTLVKEVTSDANGFFQVELSAGTYTIAVLENNLLYVNKGDGAGGLNPVIVGTGKQKLDITISYKATF